MHILMATRQAGYINEISWWDFIPPCHEVHTSSGLKIDCNYVLSVKVILKPAVSTGVVVVCRAARNVVLSQVATYTTMWLYCCVPYLTPTIWASDKSHSILYRCWTDSVRKSRRLHTAHPNQIKLHQRGIQPRYPALQLPEARPSLHACAAVLWVQVELGSQTTDTVTSYCPRHHLSCSFNMLQWINVSMKAMVLFNCTHDILNILPTSSTQELCV